MTDTDEDFDFGCDDDYDVASSSTTTPTNSSNNGSSNNYNNNNNNINTFVPKNNSPIKPLRPKLVLSLPKTTVLGSVNNNSLGTNNNNSNSSKPTATTTTTTTQNATPLSLPKKLVLKPTALTLKSTSPLKPTTTTPITNNINSSSTNSSYNNNNNLNNNNNNNNNIIVQQRQYNIQKQIIFQLISNESFSCADPNNQEITEIFKNIPNSDSIQHNGNIWWTFPIEYHDVLCQKLIPFRCIIGRLPKHILNTFFTKVKLQQQQPDEPPMDLSRLPTTLLNTLMPFQRKGLEFAISKQGRCMIADEMGLGKTIQAIAVACYYITEWPLLIITPSSLRLPWADQIEKFLGGVIDSLDIKVIMNGKCGLNGKINIISYDLVNRRAQQIADQQFKVVIADESHYIKQYKSQRTKSVLPILSKAKRAILLSGTPALSRPYELYTQVSALIPFFQSWSDYMYRYCNAQTTNYGLDYFGSSNMKELNLFLNTIMIRRLKEDVLTDLPDKIRESITIKLDKKKLVAIGKTFEQLKQAKQEMEGTNDPFTARSKKGSRSSLFLKLFRDTGLYKLDAVNKYLNEKFEEDSPTKYLVFAHHTNVIDGICHSLKKKKVEHIRIDGSTPVHSRHELVKLFQSEDSGIKVAVLSITAAGTGLTLTAASVVIFAELYWTPGTLFQAEDRAHRYGQKNSVLIQYLIAQGTADEHLWNMLQSKYNLLGKVLNDQEQTLQVNQTGLLLNSGGGDSSLEIDSFIDQILARVEYLDDERKKKLDEKKLRKNKILAKKMENLKLNEQELLILNSNDDDDDEDDDDDDDNEDGEDEDDAKSKKKKAILTKTSKKAAPKKKTSTSTTTTTTKNGVSPKVKKTTTKSNNNNNSNLNNNNNDNNNLTKTNSNTSIQVDMDEDFDQICHVDLNEFQKCTDDKLDEFLFDK
ncbi:hypothetical protein CYY_002664 [Polysphondylium violaceum]|uniref:SNF2-related domain-containing protein n=1 Tax=Polysphondylium violaceum TaxID=133409 RepID=A0A8J4V0P6_9MYCE|nr:hypothetical protein CYY_002664 [Polysphondylium violaceum]